MAPFEDETTGLIVRYLGPHGPHGLLAFADLTIVGSLILSGLMPPALGVVFGIVIYALFGVFHLQSEKSKVEIKRLEVEQTREQIRSDAVKIGIEIMRRQGAVGAPTKTTETPAIAAPSPGVGAEGKSDV